MCNQFNQLQVPQTQVVQSTVDTDGVQGDLERTRQHVAEYVALDGYYCTCYATHGGHTAKSQRAQINIACEWANRK